MMAPSRVNPDFQRSSTTSVTLPAVLKGDGDPTVRRLDNLAVSQRWDGSMRYRHISLKKSPAELRAAAGSVWTYPQGHLKERPGSQQTGGRGPTGLATRAVTACQTAVEDSMAAFTRAVLWNLTQARRTASLPRLPDKAGKLQADSGGGSRDVAASTTPQAQ
jgi:hypothetical protein